ncbi:Ig-like domain-containing protein [Nocardioides ferulae]|uniref:Ig-like domain-containing protein n=1 Tax=Nocardioides ferulae TaxID=2340821 RepID=UPI00197E301B
MTVACVDDRPVAAGDSATVDEDDLATAVDVLGNDTDVDAGPLAIASVTDPGHGTVVLTGGAAGAHTGLTYRPDLNYCNSQTGGSPDTFSYELNGGSSATVSVTVTCVDDAPVAVGDSATVTEDDPATAFDVLDNDSDIDAGPMAIASATDPANGTVVLTGGSAGARTGLTYRPDPNHCNTQSGGTPDTFDYTLNGGRSATVSVTVSCVDDAPVAVADGVTVTEDDAASPVDVLGNDTDVDAGPMSVVSVTDPAHGTVVVTGGGSGLTYEPDADYCNSGAGPVDTFDYTLNGGDTASVSVTVACVDDPPSAVDDSPTLAEDDAATAVDVLANDANADGGPLSIAAATQPANGTVLLTGGVAGAHEGLTYEPDADYCNSQSGGSPDTFGYTLNGGDAATVSVTVTCADDAPAAVDDSATVTEDDPATAVDVLANDTDIDAGPMRIASATDPQNGTVALTGGSAGAHTGLTYRPDADYCDTGAGPDDTFDYTLNGGDTATVSLTVTCVDDAPVAFDDTATVRLDATATAVDVLANDTDIDGGPKRITSATDPDHGTVVLTGGTPGAHTGLTYRPDPAYCNDPPGTSPDTFDYSLAGGSTATVSVTVVCDAPPTAVDDSATVAEDAAATPVAVLANDTDTDGGPKVVASATDPANGTVALTGGTAGAHTGLTYRPDADYCNSGAGSDDTFSYTLNGGSTATVSVTVTCLDDAPVAVDDSATVDEDSGATAVVVLTNDTDVDDGPKTITTVTQPTNGTVVITGGGSGLTYAPDADYCSSQTGGSADAFTYTLNGGDTASVSVTVTCVDDAPSAVADSPTLDEDAPATAVEVLTNDDNADGGPLAVASATQPAHGTVVLTGGVAGAHEGLTYEPDPNYCNSQTGGTADTFDYALNGGSSATVSVTVTCVDDAPTAVDDVATVRLDDPATAVDVLANDTDIDAGPMRIASTTDPANGTVALTGGTAGAHTGLTYRPDPGYCNEPPGTSPDTFDYTLVGGSSATVSLTVICDTPPVAVDDTETVAEDSSATAVDVLANDTDVDGGPMTIASATDPVNGTVVLTGGTAGEHTGLTYEPDADYCNLPPGATPDTFTYALNGGDSATVSVSVTCVDDDPVAVDDLATVAEDSGATAIPVLANESDVDGGPKTITAVTQPANGTVVITGGGTGLTYAPAANYCNEPPGTATDDFTYTLAGGPTTATVSTTVTCVNDAPVADDELFDGAGSAVGNTVLVVDDPTDAAPAHSGPRKAITGDILAGDTDIDTTGPLAVTAGTFATNDGGSVVLQADGDFVYTPAPGCSDGSDHFDYTVSDQETPTPGTDTGRVTINVSGCVWYVANDAAGNAGTSTAPFDTLVQAQAASGTGHTIYLYEGDGTATGHAAGIDLKADQRLLGELADLEVGGHLLAAGVAGARPIVANAGADVVSLAAGNTVRGLRIDPQGSGGGIAGGAGDAAGTIADVQIVDTGVAGTQPGLELDGTSGTWSISDLVVDNSAATGTSAGSVGVRLSNAGTVTFADAGTVSVTTKGAKALDVTGTGLGTSVFDALTVTGSSSGAVSLVTTTGSTTFSNLALATTSGATAAFALGNAGTVTVPASGTANVTAVGGPAIDVTGTAGATLGFDTVISTDSAHDGVNLSGLGSGTFSAGPSSAISNATEVDFDLDGGTGAVTYDGTITDDVGQLVRVANATGGTKDFNGTITDGDNGSGQGIALSANTGATVRFDGGVTLSTGTNPAFSATDGGTVAVTDPAGAAANALTTTSATALTVTNTAIHGDGLTFQSITSNGAPRGILLSTTGSSGRLVVTGAGGTCTAASSAGCSGGVIANGSGGDDSGATPTGTGIVLANTLGPSLTRMWIHDHTNYAIRGTGVTGFTLADSVVNGANGNNGGTPFDDSSIRFENLAGAASITDSHISGGFEDNLRVQNDTGSLNRLTITRTTFGLGSDRPTNDAVFLGSTAGAGQLQATITDSTFSSAGGDLLQFDHIGSGAGDLVLTGNTFSNANSTIATGGGGVSLFSGGTGAGTTMTISGNSFRDAVGTAVLLVKTPGSAGQTGTFQNNIVGVSGVANSGSAEGSGVKIQHAGGGTQRWSVAGNQIRQYNNFGIDVQAGAGVVADGTVVTTITGNTIEQPGNSSGTVGFQKYGLHFNIGVTPSDSFLACGVITGNTLSASGSNSGNFDVRLRQRQSTTFRLPGYPGVAGDTTAVSAFVSAANGAGTDVSASAAYPGSGGGFTGQGCP